MKRVNKKNVIIAAVLLALFGLAQLFCALRLQSLERSLPRAAVLSNPGGVGISIKQAMTFGSMEKATAGAMSAWQQQAVSAVTGASGQALTAFATPGMGLCLPMLYTFGSWFLTGNNIAPCAVLPKSLSLKLFGTDRPSGSAILIGQTEYMICGVYSEYGAVAEEKDFLHTISSDGIPRVYLFDPLRVADVQVSMLYMTDAKGSDAQYLLDQASGFQKKALSGSLTDYRPRLGLAASLWYFSVLVCALFVFTLLLYAAGHQLIAAASAQKEAGKKRLLRLLAGVAATAGILLVLSSLLSRLAIPPSYLPRDNVFELSFYVRTVESFFASLHAAGGSNPYDWVFLTHTLAILLWSLLGLVFFIPAALKCRRILLAIFRRNS